MLFVLSSCTDRRVAISYKKYSDPPGEYTSLYMSAEILTRSVQVGESLDVKVGFGRERYSYGPEEKVFPNAVLRVYAPDIAFILPDGTEVSDRLRLEYTDFENFDKYEISYRGETVTLPYFETIRLSYVGTEKECYGTIYFTIGAWQSEEMPDETEVFFDDSTGVCLYYEVHNGFFRLRTTRNPFGRY